MKANCWVSPNEVEVQDVPDPKILNSRDAIVKITSTAICGSDLHLLDGYVPTMQTGDVMGHEFMGEVVEVGPAVSPDKLKVGDRVVVPFPIACGAAAWMADSYWFMVSPPWARMLRPDVSDPATSRSARTSDATVGTGGALSAERPIQPRQGHGVRGT